MSEIIRISNERLLNLPPDTTDLAEKFADAGRNMACELYQNYTDWTKKIPLNNNVISDYLHGFWDNLCYPDYPPIPPSPTNEIPGGCNALRYNIFCAPEDQQPNTGYDQVATVWGPIGQFRYQDNDPKVVAWTNTKFLTFVTCYGTNVGQSGAPDSSASEVNIAGGNYSFYRPYKIERVDGQPESCEIVPAYPIPSQSDTNKNISITYKDGTDVNFPITYNDFDADFNLNIDVGGVKLGFDLGGVTINFNPNNRPTLTERVEIIEAEIIENNNIVNTINNNTSNSNDTNTTVNTINNLVFEMAESITEIKEKECPEVDCCEENEEDSEPNDANYHIITRPIRSSDVFTNLIGLRWIRLEITDFPNANKIQFGAGAPNIYFAGWLQFMNGEYCFDRIPISHEKNIYKAPSNCDGYSYTLTYRGKGYATVYIDK